MPSRENVSAELVEKRTEVINELRNLSVGLDEILASTITKGVAFHRR